MDDAKKSENISRREFLAKSARGTAALGISPILLDSVWVAKSIARWPHNELLLPEDVM